MIAFTKWVRSFRSGTLTINLDLARSQLSLFIISTLSGEERYDRDLIIGVAYAIHWLLVVMAAFSKSIFVQVRDHCHPALSFGWAPPFHWQRAGASISLLLFLDTLSTWYQISYKSYFSPTFLDFDSQSIIIASTMHSSHIICALSGFCLDFLTMVEEDPIISNVWNYV